MSISRFIAFFFLLISCVIFTECQTSSYIAVKENVATNQVSYNTHIKPIIDNYCTTCHAGANPSAGFRLETYAQVRKQIETGELLQRINNARKPMPVSGLMSKNERTLIARWVKNTFLEVSNSSDTSQTKEGTTYQFTPPTITPINIEEIETDFLQKMQGHWVGKMNLMGQNIPWFSFDYRAISASHVHGIFEGGTIGNLFTSFFIANFKGVKTIMARNGGILNGIYRTSYFVLDKTTTTTEESFYRFVDAYGGKQIMYMELSFRDDQIDFSSYTSRFGMKLYPQKHMSFKASKMHSEVAYSVAEKLNYPSYEVEKDFSNGLPTPEWDQGPITSASYLWKDISKDLVSLGKLSKDPIRIDEMPYLSKVTIKMNRPKSLKGKKINLYLSLISLTNEFGKLPMKYGYIKESIMNEVVLFPEIDSTKSEFELTYLHPGEYYVTAMIDLDGNQAPSEGDAYNKSAKLIVQPNSTSTFTVAPFTTIP